MSCERFREIASARQDGEATHAELAELGLHQVDCADCRTWVAEMTAARRRLAEWSDERPSRPLQLPRRRSSWQGWAAAAVMAIVALGIGFAAGRASAPPGEVGEWPEPSPRTGFVEEQRTVYPARNEVHSEAVLSSASYPGGDSRRVR